MGGPREGPFSSIIAPPPYPETLLCPSSFPWPVIRGSSFSFQVTVLGLEF